MPLIRRRTAIVPWIFKKIRLFRNFHTFVRLPVDKVLEQSGFGIADIMVRRKADPHPISRPNFAAEDEVVAQLFPWPAHRDTAAIG
jgi:hypothetical protein